MQVLDNIDDALDDLCGVFIAECLPPVDQFRKLCLHQLHPEENFTFDLFNLMKQMTSQLQITTRTYMLELNDVRMVN